MITWPAGFYGGHNPSTRAVPATFQRPIWHFGVSLTFLPVPSRLRVALQVSSTKEDDRCRKR